MIAQPSVRVAGDGCELPAPVGDELADDVEEVRAEAAHQHVLPGGQAGVLALGGHAGFDIAQAKALSDLDELSDFAPAPRLDHSLREDHGGRGEPPSVLEDDGAQRPVGPHIDRESEELLDLDVPARDRRLELVAEVDALQAAAREVVGPERRGLGHHPLPRRMRAVGRYLPCPGDEIGSLRGRAAHRSRAIGVDGRRTGLGVVEVLRRLLHVPGRAGADGDRVDERDPERRCVA